jgi:hypothetical protein
MGSSPPMLDNAKGNLPPIVCKSRSDNAASEPEYSFTRLYSCFWRK